jgi:hypothetical protein
MRRLGSALLAVGLFVGCGGIEAEESSPSFAHQQAPLTELDVDVAPECQGLIDFVNVAPFQTLDAYLPSDVATNLVTQRAASPFVTLADVAAVRLVGPARLEQIELGARTEGFIGSSCVGILDDLAVSADDEAELVALVNSLSSTELHDILPYAWNGATNLLNLRPFTTARAISNTSGIGSVSFRNLRNAAMLSRPFEELASAVNALPQGYNGARLARHFDWHAIVADAQDYYYRYSMECFGIDPALLPQGTTLRPHLATAAEVQAEVAGTVSWANWNGQIPSSVVSSGLANLDARTAGRTFKGCYIRYSNDPWSGTNIAFFIDTVTGFAVLSELRWSE